MRCFTAAARSILPPLALAAVALIAAPAAAIQFDSFDPARHERFLPNDAENPDFLLAGVDTSGVARSKSFGSGAALITPQHFLTADHFKPGNPGSTVTFRGTDGIDRSYTIAGYDQLTTFGDGSDLSIGTLVSPIDAQTDFINPLPIAVPPTTDLDDFIGLEVYTFGKDDLAGRNVITDVSLAQFGSGDPRPSYTFTTIYDTAENGGTGLGPDEAGLQGGDSGNTAITVIDGQAALLGTHFGIASGLPDNSNLTPFSDDDPYLNLSTLTAPYLSQINTIVQSNNQTFQTLTIPEPSTAALVLFGLAVTTLRRSA